MSPWACPKTRSTASERYPHDSSTSSTPWRPSRSSMNDRNGRPASGITGFGSVSVSGRRRVPSPPASTRACISAADALVREAGAAQQLGVEVVAAVDDERVGHPALDLAGPVELVELRPLGDEHGRLR